MNATRPLALFGATLSISLAALSCGPAGENLPPDVQLSPIGPEATYTIGEEIIITAYAEDPDGDEMSFEWIARTDNELSTVESTANFIPTAQTATFRWTPDSADITRDEPLRLIFVVTDARGARVEREKRINIAPGNGKPVLDSSSNQLYKDCCDKPFSFEVRVKDADSDEVTLTMKSGPGGAEFDQIDKKKGRFTWQPQASDGEQRLHTAVFVIDDGDNPPVEETVNIVIPRENPGGPGRPTDTGNDICVGERLIEHNPLGAQREPEPGFDINATLLAGSERYDSYVLFWSDRDPSANPEATVYSTEMTKSGSIITGTIPNIAATTGETQKISYKICLLDTQAGEDDPDALVCNPTVNELFHTFIAYPEASAPCADDALDASSAAKNDTRQTASGLPETTWDSYVACEGDPDFHGIKVRPGQSYAFVTSYPLGAALNIELLDVTGAPVDGLEVSECSGLQIGEVSLPSDASAADFYLKITGDDVPYHVTAIETAAGAGCSDEDLEPNASADTAAPLDIGSLTTELEICPDGADNDVYAIELDHGDQLTVTMNHPASSANLDMTLYSPNQADFPDLNGVAFTFSIGADEEVLEYEARHCGTYYLRVFSNDAAAPYSLNVDAVKGAGCVDDDTRSASDCNHTPASASLFPWNVALPDLKVCSKGEDWYRHKGNDAYVIAEVDVTSGDPSGLKLEIYDSKANLLETGDLDGNSSILEYTFPDDDTYFFRVYSPNTIEYTIEVLAE